MFCWPRNTQPYLCVKYGDERNPGRKDLRRVLMIGFSHGQDIIAHLSVLRKANLRGTLRVGGTGDQALGGSPIRNVRDGRRAALKGSAKELPQAALNSLWGAALVQGMMFVARLRQKFPGVPVTETHPKATAVALGGWEPANPSVRLPGRRREPYARRISIRRCRARRFQWAVEARPVAQPRPERAGPAGALVGPRPLLLARGIARRRRSSSTMNARLGGDRPSL